VANYLRQYHHVMICYAVVFLLKVSTKYTSYVRVDTAEIKSLITELVAVLKKVTLNMHPRHVLKSISKGVEKLLDAAFASDSQPPTIYSPDVRYLPTPEDTLVPDPNLAWMGNAWSMAQFDLLPDPTIFEQHQYQSHPAQQQHQQQQQQQHNYANMDGVYQQQYNMSGYTYHMN
jgi:hypothetical protein